MKILRYFYHMIPVIGYFIKDLIWEGLSFEETRTNYLFGKAHAFDCADLFKGAIGVYQKILEQNPNSLPVLLGLGGIYFRRGLYNQAIQYYEKAIQKNPKHYLAHYWLAMCFLKLHRYHAAINTLEEVIGFLPTFKDALNLMGECYEKIGEAAKAEHCYLKAISVDPDGIILHGGIVNPPSQDKGEERRIKH
ncbi:MAG: tetratricopeptide repeat protein [Thermodesulfobacteriota bacterium]